MKLHLELLERAIKDIHLLNRTKKIVLKNDINSEEKVIYQPVNSNGGFEYLYTLSDKGDALFCLKVSDIGESNYLTYKFYSCGAVEIATQGIPQDSLPYSALYKFRYYFNDFIDRQNKYINAIFSFNYQAGILNQGSSVDRTTEFIVSELMEMNGISKSEKAEMLKPFKTDNKRPIIDKINDDIDIIIYAMGELMKDVRSYGVKEEKIMKCVNALISQVATFNLSKLDEVSVNSKGKVIKPDSFEEPDNDAKLLIDCYK